jgi:t-SNARE complex subunit (syntaxin)
MSELNTFIANLMEHAKSADASIKSSGVYKNLIKSGENLHKLPILNMTEEEKETLKKNLEGFIK